jgi:DNA-binding transcriptional ArsR family regulator
MCESGCALIDRWSRRLLARSDEVPDARTALWSRRWFSEARRKGSILELLEQHGSLAYEQIAALLREPPDAVRNALTQLGERGLVDAVALGRLEGTVTTAASYSRLTDEGRAELARRRSHQP